MALFIRVHDVTTATKDNGFVGATVRQKDFRIPKSYILESASEGEFRVVQVPPVETEEDGLSNECDCRQGSTDCNCTPAAVVAVV